MNEQKMSKMPELLEQTTYRVDFVIPNSERNSFEARLMKFANKELQVYGVDCTGFSIHEGGRQMAEGMTVEDLRAWMKLVNTQTLELILLQGDKPTWFTDEMTAEVQRRRDARKGDQ